MGKDNDNLKETLENISKKKDEIKKNTYKEEKTGRFCSACSGEIVERFRRVAKYAGRRGVYGPGGRHFTGYGDFKSEGFHCGICKNEYHELPPKDIFKAKSKS